MDQIEGEGSLGFEVGQAGIFSNSQSRKGPDVVDGDDRMVPEEGGDLSFSCSHVLSSSHHPQ